MRTAQAKSFKPSVKPIEVSPDNSAIAGSTSALPTSADDPIFAVITEWERLEATHIAAINVTDSLVDARAPDEDPRFVAAREAQEEACGVVCDFEGDMLFTTAPTTLAGSITLLRLVAQDLSHFSGHNCRLRAAVCNVVAVLEREEHRAAASRS